MAHHAIVVSPKIFYQYETGKLDFLVIPKDTATAKGVGVGDMIHFVCSGIPIGDWRSGGLYRHIKYIGTGNVESDVDFPYIIAGLK